MIQKLSRNRLERRNTQSTLLLGGVRYMINMLLYIIEAWQLSLQMWAKPASNVIILGGNFGGGAASARKEWADNHFCSAHFSLALAAHLAPKCSPGTLPLSEPASSLPWALGSLSCVVVDVARGLRCQLWRPDTFFIAPPLLAKTFCSM